MNSQGSKVKKNAHAQRVQVQRKDFTNEVLGGEIYSSCVKGRSKGHLIGCSVVNVLIELNQFVTMMF